MSTYFPIAGNLDGVKTEEDMTSRHVLYTKVDEEQSLLKELESIKSYKENNNKPNSFCCIIPVHSTLNIIFFQICYMS
jgi:hypothetical protein